MAVQDPACAQLAQAIDTSERVRAYEIAAYLSAASFPFDSEDGPPVNPVPNTDPTLNALVQHGVHKMECDRAFLSFIDNRNQFICAEMTRNQSLSGQDPAQPLLLGTTRIALEWGVCPYTMSIFHGKEVAIPKTPYIVANESYFCIKDFREVPSFATRPYVAGYPHMVSYIEIPLRSLSGHILGSYCVVDNKARDFLHHDSLRIIREITSAISSYLDLKRAEAGRLRSERMMDGLRQFTNSDQRTLSVDSVGAQTSSRSKLPFELDVFEQPSQDNSRLRMNEEMTNDSPTRGPVDLKPALQPPPVHATGFTPALSDAAITIRPEPTTVTGQASTDISTQISNLYIKAANVIGHAMDLDGLVFFDPVPGDTSGGSRLSSTDKEFLQPTKRNESLTTSLLSTFQGDASNGEQMVYAPSRSLIHRLTAAHPHGHVVSVDAHGVFEQSASTTNTSHHSKGESAAYNDWDDLFGCIPKARYAIFLPQWHYQRESCFSTCLAWVSDPSKTLDVSDVNSLTAFGHSLMAEVIRLEAATNTQLKSDFISSISHELRSPLHGILATTELLQASIKDPQTLSLTQMIESCSHTLLDTFDHLLEFSGINSRGSSKSQYARTDKSNHYAGKAPDSEAETDLSSLVEDIVETASLSHFSASQMETGLRRESQDLSAGQIAHTKATPTLTTTYIECGHSWMLNVDKGAWKRILLNVYSNALKYTESGHIDVTLRMLDPRDEGPEHISLSVNDTGLGMSPEFLKYHLFTPFMQEDNLVPGTGLGLSLVKSIVESLDGKIYVQSHQHEGTHVTINLPINRKARTPSEAKSATKPASDDNFHGLTVGLISITSANKPDGKPGACVAAPSKLLRRSLQNICADYFGMKVVDNEPIGELLKKSVVFLDTHTLSPTDVTSLQRLLTEHSVSTVSQALVILTAMKGKLEQNFDVKKAICITSPITRSALRAAFTTALSQSANFGPTPYSPTSDVDKDTTAFRSEQEPPSKLYTEDTSATVLNNAPNLPFRSSTSKTNLDVQADSPSVSTSPKHVAAVSPSRSGSTCRFTRFLLVDDNPINLKVITAFAKRMDRPYSTAINGAEAVHLYEKAVLEEAHPFDCVLMDISMPVMDGFQATMAIRQFEQQQHQHRSQNANKQESTGVGESTVLSPVLRSCIMALTGLGSDSARKQARTSGFDEFLLKPLKFKDLMPLLRPLPVDDST